MTAASVANFDRTPLRREGSLAIRLLGLSGLVVSASLATAVASTTITGLILGEEESPVTPTTQPIADSEAVAPSTQPSEAVLHKQQNETWDAVTYAAAQAGGGGGIAIADADFVALGLEHPLVSATARRYDTGAAQRFAIVAANQADSDSKPRDVKAQRDAIRAAFDATFTGAGSTSSATAALPMTFGGSPDLADAFNSFRTQPIRNAAGYESPSDVTSDAVPPLGADAPSANPTNGSAGGAADQGVDPVGGLTWETDVNTRPNGELVPPPPTEGGYVYQDGDHPTDPFSGWTGPTDLPEEIPPVGSVMTPEPASLLSLTLGVAALGARRRRH